MIKKIYLNNLNDLLAKPIEIEFDRHLNMIIGPKGGGKSTLFFLVAGLKKNIMYDIVKNALKEFGFEFLKAENFSGDFIYNNQLSNEKFKDDQKKHFESRNDIIYQDDIIKKELINLDEIKKEKKKYIEKQLTFSKDYIKFVSKLKDLYIQMKNLYELNKTENVDINWSMLFQLQNKNAIKNDKLFFLTNFNYDNLELKNSIKEEKEDNKVLIHDITMFNAKLKQKLDFNYYDILKDDSYTENLNKQINLSITSNQQIVSLLKARNNFLKRNLIFINSFDKAFQKSIEKIKNENEKIAPIKLFESRSLDHFRKMASIIKNVENKFEEIRTFDEEFVIENENNQFQKINFHIPSKIFLSEEEIIKIFEVIFYKGDSLSDARKWLEELMSRGLKLKVFEEEKIRNKLSTFLFEKTKVLIDDGRDYETLSLGQKSIYGLKYKFNKSKNDDLFMDQPEDNLDNNTIATEVLPLIKEKKQQVFIVTHNANIGILTNPERIIVCDLNNKNHPYKSISFAKEINNESVNLLEGGKQFLEERFNKIIKGDI